MRVLVTGGGGFLGSRLAELLRQEGHEVSIGRRRDYDLTAMEDTQRLFDDTDPELVFHLAAEVGGIGANRANPGRYWYANLMMGAHVLEQARLHATPKLVIAGTICAYPKFTPVPFREEDLWNGLSGGDERSLRRRQEGAARQAPVVPPAVRHATSIYLLPVNLYGPGDNFDLETSHVIPALIRKMVEARDAGRRRSCCGATAPPPASSSTSTTARDALALAAERYDGADPVNLGTGEEIAIRDLAELVRDATGFDGEIRWDTSKPNGQPRRRLDTTRAEELFGFRAAVPLRDGIARTVAWYRSSVAG